MVLGSYFWGVMWFCPVTFLRLIEKYRFCPFYYQKIFIILYLHTMACATILSFLETSVRNSFGKVHCRVQLINICCWLELSMSLFDRSLILAHSREPRLLTSEDQNHMKVNVPDLKKVVFRDFYNIGIDVSR